MVPQGTVFGPTLFDININGMPKILKNKVRLYADDSKLVSYVDRIENIMIRYIAKSLQIIATQNTVYKQSSEIKYNFR